MRRIPTMDELYKKFLRILNSDRELKRRYFSRFNIEDLDDLYNRFNRDFGGYELKKRNITSVPIQENQTVSTIGPWMGQECLMLAELFDKVLVFEPDRVVKECLERIAEHYLTEDGRKASEVLKFHQAGIINPKILSSYLRNRDSPLGTQVFDIEGAKNIRDVYGTEFTDRLVCNGMINTIAYGESYGLPYFINELASYLKKDGTLTWSEDFGELKAASIPHLNIFYYEPIPGDIETLKYPIESRITELASESRLETRFEEIRLPGQGQYLLVIGEKH